MSDYQKQDLEEKLFCAKCNSLVEETLLLACEHNLCLNCASSNLLREEAKNIHNHPTVICDICLSQTTLDSTTANELLQIDQNYNSNRKAAHSKTDSNLGNINLDRKVHSSMNINESLLNMSLISKAYNNPNNATVKKEYCKEHGEELTYYCLDCLCTCICSECVVHGIHKNHEVMNIKRAYPLVLEKSEDLLYQVQNRIEDINNVQKSIESKKKDLVDNSNVLKQEMIKVFEEIRLRLTKKEKEVMDKTEQYLNEHLQELNTYLRVLQSKVVSFNKLIDSISSNISRRDELNLLNFYSENKNRIIQYIQNEIPEIPDFRTLYNMKVNINQSSFENLINTLNAVHIEITSIKGFEVQKVQNNQKFVVKRELYGSKSNTGNIGNYNTYDNFNSSLYNNKLGTNTGNINYNNPSNEVSNHNLNVSFKSLNSNLDDYSDRYKNKIY